jgi:hypothetical protein
MAGRRSIEPPAGDESALVLPRELADNTGLTAEEYRAFWKARNAWFRAHGIDPGDWSAVYPVPKASWAAHGIVITPGNAPDGGSRSRSLLRKHWDSRAGNTGAE